MPSNYEEICQDNIRRRGEEFDDIGRLISEQLYSDRSHFIYELLQNAEDALGKRLRHNSDKCSNCGVQFRLYHDRLEFRHFGIPFNEDDVKGISDILKGTKEKDVSQIGKFGIGFKSVYAFTGSPEIHSGDEHFVIKRYIRPEKKEPNHCLSKAPDETVFIFPFDHNELSATEAFRLILNKLRRLGPRVLLFLKWIDGIEWSVAPKGEKGYYQKVLEPIGKAHRITVTGKKNKQKEDERWLIFERSVTVPEKSDQVTVEIGYRIETKDEKDSIVSIDRSPLVVYFPTEKETPLGFLMQGPYRTTPARDNIPYDDPWNKVLIEETAQLVVDSLHWLKELKLLSITLLRSLPIKIKYKYDRRLHESDHRDLYKEFYPIFKSVQNSLVKKELLPANGGMYAPARNAKLARGADLMKVLNHEQLGALFQSCRKIRWLSNEITEVRTPDLRLYLMQVLNVEEIDPEVFVRKLSKPFLTGQKDNWFIRFYEFLSKRPGLWMNIRTKPILRLQDGSQMRPFRDDGSPIAYLADGPDVETSLPIVKIKLSQNKKVHRFLKRLGIPDLDIVAEVFEKILPKYKGNSTRIEFEEHKRDLKKIEQAYNTDSHKNKMRLQQQLRKTPFILGECPSTGKTVYRKPDQLYFSTDELRLYFEGNDTFACVSQNHPLSYLFRDLGVEDEVRIQRRKIKRQGFVSIVDIHSWHKRGLAGFDPNIRIDGLECAMSIPTPGRSNFIWNRIAIPNSDCIRGFVEESTQKTYLKSTKEEQTSKKFGELLCSLAWLPDTNDNMHKPCELTLDDLPESFVRDEKLADKLGMKKNDLEKLAKKSGVEIKDIEFIKQNSEEFNKWKEAIKAKPSLPTRSVKDPKRRHEKLLEQLDRAPTKVYENKQRSSRSTRAEIDPTTYLKNQYTNDSGQLICQVCYMEMPFKKRNGEYYFEEVEALSKDYLTKEYEAQFLALCPECAARYKEFLKRDENAMKNLYHALINSTEPEVPLKLGELETNLRFVETHWQDMKTILNKRYE